MQPIEQEHDPNIQVKWAEVLVASLAGAGIRQVVISPGSRSTPLVLALQSCPALSLQTVVDERSAAFLALGQSKRSGRPSLLVCTSGSAAAHYLPAVLEAFESQIPLLLITADRPPELQGNRAPQTTDQTQLFGAHIRAYFELGVADMTADSSRALTRKATQAVDAASTGPRGPVHLNFKVRKPLETMLEAYFDRRADRGTPDNIEALTTPRAIAGRCTLSKDQLVELADSWARAERPVLVIGPHAPFQHPNADSVDQFLTASGWPLVAETPSNLSHLGGVWHGFDLCQRSKLHALRPDLILQIGDPPTSGAWATETRDCRRIIVSEHAWPDPTNRAEAVIRVEPSSLLEGLSGVITKGPTSWTQVVNSTDQAAWGLVERHCRLQNNADLDFDDLQAAYRLSQALTKGDQLVLGNSLPIRVFESASGPKRAQLTCITQRGVNGIDGLIAGAIGAAQVHKGQTWLLLGDVSLLHDIGSLQVLSSADVQLCVVVLNNGGGQLFGHLPISTLGNDDTTRDRLSAWTTPHSINLASVASALGVKAQRVTSLPAFAAGLTEARSDTGPQLIEVMTSPTGSRRAYEELTQALARTMANSL